MTEDTNAPAVRPQSPRAMALAMAIRRARGDMRQVDYAELIGRPQSVVSNWETGLSTPSLDALAALEQGIGLPLGTLAAEAGYVEVESDFARGKPIVVRRFSNSAEALEFIAAADVVGLSVKATSSASVEAAGNWLVAIGAPVEEPGP